MWKYDCPFLLWHPDDLMRGLTVFEISMKAWEKQKQYFNVHALRRTMLGQKPDIYVYGSESTYAPKLYCGEKLENSPIIL